MKNTTKRITITISSEADAMLSALSARDLRSRGAVIEMLLRDAQNATKRSVPSHFSDTSSHECDTSSHCNDTNDSTSSHLCDTSSHFSDNDLRSEAADAILKMAENM